MKLVNLFHNVRTDHTLFTASLWVLATAFLGMLVITRMYWTTPKGTCDLCFGCDKTLSRLRRIMSSAPFCCRDCKDNYDARFRTEAISRLWSNRSGEVLIEDVLMYSTAILVGGGIYRYFHPVLWLIFHHVQQYAGCSLPPGGCQ
jgi:hypothetical protein